MTPVFRYYCSMRPPGPGAIPRGAALTNAYETRQYIPEIDRMAWGWVEYTRELTPAEIADYELIMHPRDL